MNKSELVEAIAQESGLSRADAKRALEAFVSTTTNVLKSGGKLSLVGFGSFSILERAERKGRNPKTGQKITIGAKKTAKFKPGSDLIGAIN
ncbi:MAG: DNA-binding protein [Flavobacteriales bacterium]|nr:DNA-binding protein [Flavobacteriales bacterium]|tara:strand:+ start:1329 stop:1601 length:273 start_codon:yes stop_codon:yes gene_type:complete